MDSRDCAAPSSYLDKTALDDEVGLVQVGVLRRQRGSERAVDIRCPIFRYGREESQAIIQELNDRQLVDVKVLLLLPVC